MLACATISHFKSKAQNTIATDTRENRFLQNDFAVSAFEHFSTDSRVLAFGVFTYNEKIDIACFAVSKRARHAVKQADWTQVDVLIKFATEFEERAI